jgi:hypothetical protein
MLDDSTSEPKLKLYDSGPVKLAEFVIDDTGSSVAAGTGDITIAIATQEDAALASGTAAYLDFCDGDDTVHYRLSCQQGTVAVAGKCVMNSLAIVAGAPVDILSVSIPAGAVFS